MVDVLFENHQHRVVTGDGAQHFGRRVAVDVVGQTAGISGTGLDDCQVAREVDGDEAPRDWTFGVVGQLLLHEFPYAPDFGHDEDVGAVAAGNLGDAQLLQVAREGGLGQVEARFMQTLQNFVLAFYPGVDDDFSYCL